MWKHKKSPFETVGNLDMNFEGPFYIYFFIIFKIFQGQGHMIRSRSNFNLSIFFIASFFSLHYSAINLIISYTG